MMNSEHEDREPGIGADASADAETQLKSNREILRQGLAREKDSGGLGDIDAIVSMAVPVVRQFIRQHPYASLSGAALIGVWLIRIKPWRVLGGPLLVGLLERQALNLSLSSGSQLLEGLTSAARSKQTPKRKP